MSYEVIARHRRTLSGGDIHDERQRFGPFVQRTEAERCVTALAARADVMSAVIKPVEDGGDS